MSQVHTVRRATCPRCAREVNVRDGRWARHLPNPEGGEYCTLSMQMAAVEGDDPKRHERRAAQVCDLATQLRDVDPRIVWDVLTTTSAGELQRLLMVALAAIDVDKPMNEIFGWVRELPAAGMERTA